MTTTTAPAMTALEHLIARYSSLNGHTASDGYNDRDEQEVIAAARAESAEMRRVCGVLREACQEAYREIGGDNAERYGEILAAALAAARRIGDTRMRTKAQRDWLGRLSEHDRKGIAELDAWVPASQTALALSSTSPNTST